MHYILQGLWPMLLVMFGMISLAVLCLLGMVVASLAAYFCACWSLDSVHYWRTHDLGECISPLNSATIQDRLARLQTTLATATSILSACPDHDHESDWQSDYIYQCYEYERLQMPSSWIHFGDETAADGHSRTQQEIEYIPMQTVYVDQKDHFESDDPAPGSTVVMLVGDEVKLFKRLITSRRDCNSIIENPMTTDRPFRQVEADHAFIWTTGNSITRQGLQRVVLDDNELTKRNGTCRSWISNGRYDRGNYRFGPFSTLYHPFKSYKNDELYYYLGPEPVRALPEADVSLIKEALSKGKPPCGVASPDISLCRFPSEASIASSISRASVASMSRSTSISSMSSVEAVTPPDSPRLVTFDETSAEAAKLAGKTSLPFRRKGRMFFMPSSLKLRSKAKQ